MQFRIYSGYWVGFILGVVCSKKTLFLFRLAMEKNVIIFMSLVGKYMPGEILKWDS